jgi:hypothetical protein
MHAPSFLATIQVPPAFSSFGYNNFVPFSPYIFGEIVGRAIFSSLFEVKTNPFLSGTKVTVHILFYILWLLGQGQMFHQ